jgi:hypothetical protein
MMTYPLGRSEVEPHHDTSQGRVADLSKAGVGNHASGAEVEVFHDHVFVVIG